MDSTGIDKSLPSKRTLTFSKESVIIPYSLSFLLLL